MPVDHPSKPPPKPRALLPVTMAFLGLLLVIILVQQSGRRQPKTMDQFLSEVRRGEVVKITRGDGVLEYEREKNRIKGESDQTRFQVFYFGGRAGETIHKVIDDAIAEGNRVRTADGSRPSIGDEGVPPQSPWMSMTFQVLILVGFVVLLWLLFFRRMGQGGGILSFGKSRATLVIKGKTGKTFKDVAGIDEAKEEVEELVEFLREPRKFQRLGGRIPRGVLLVGPPGTGKTLLAKAIAGEADVPFFSISGSDFVEMFVGVGASRVRDLFQQAKDTAPCIIFIDEIDAVARRRGASVTTGSHDEREQTLNAILVEMDGFASNEKVIVIAATNRRDVLDPALVRPGRFDRHIQVELPDIDGREQILQVHCAKVKMDPSVDLTIVARGTPGFSGADLENLINESALHAARNDQDTVLQHDLEYARDRIAFGREKKTGSRGMIEEERRLTAYHEAGHAIIQHILPECDDLHKVTIIPRGGFLGATFSLPTDRKSVSMKKLLGDICTLFGGRLAEERFCDDITTGARQDIEIATRLARAMVYELGMSSRMGPMCYTIEADGWTGPERMIAVSEETRRELDAEVRRVLDDQFERARKLVEEQACNIDRVAQALLERETLLVEQVDILLKGGELEPRAPTLRHTSPEDDEDEQKAAERRARRRRRRKAANDNPALEPM